jgi:hypothetical protein
MTGKVRAATLVAASARLDYALLWFAIWWSYSAYPGNQT